nr:MAG TPA: hypothetical protein [Caudoviricetes sp.]
MVLIAIIPALEIIPKNQDVIGLPVYGKAPIREQCHRRKCHHDRMTRTSSPNNDTTNVS